MNAVVTDRVYCGRRELNKYFEYRANWLEVLARIWVTNWHIWLRFLVVFLSLHGNFGGVLDEHPLMLHHVA
jgi:hypothetical protein